MRCPKCKHKWISKPRRKTKFKFPYAESGPGEVFPQRCWECSRGVTVGENVMAHNDQPAIICGGCKKKIRGRYWSKTVVIEVSQVG